MSVTISPRGRYRKRKTTKELKPLPNYMIDKEHDFPFRSGIDSNGKAGPAQWSNTSPTDYGEDRKLEYVPETPGPTGTTESLDARSEAYSLELIDSVGSLPYDPLSNFLMKYEKNPQQFLLMCSLWQIHKASVTASGPYLLPNRDEKDTRKTLVLDMDETLIHCFFQHEEDTSYDWRFTLENGESLTDVFCWVRPHLQEFLRAASMMYEIVVFTASQEPYANKVLDYIDPSGYIQHRLYRKHCTQIYGSFVKDLSLLNRPLSQTVIIDNSPISFAFQPSNGILCDDWFSDQRDCELLHLVPILQLLHAANDVRVDLTEIFYLAQFLSELCDAFAENEELCRMTAQAGMQGMQG